MNYFEKTWGEQANEKYWDLLSKNDVVYYCEANNAELKDRCSKNSKFLYRPWHDERWMKVPKQVRKEYDICFIGSATPRRQKVLEELKERGLKVFTGNDLFSTERDHALAKAKIILNIHAHENSSEIELWRINYLASNGLFILSENSKFETGEAEIAQQIEQASFEELSKKPKS